MKYEITLTEDAEYAIDVLKDILGVEGTQDVLSLCLGFVYQLMLLAQENEQVRKFVGVLGEKFKADQKDLSNSN